MRGFVALLGISENKYTRTSDLPLMVGVFVDGSCPIHPRFTPQCDQCHHFFRQLYTSVAEVLPKSTTHGVGYSSEDEYDELDGRTPDRREVDIVGCPWAKRLTVRQLPLWYMV